MLDPWSITLTGSVATPHLERGQHLEYRVWANAVGDT
jgi:hypothetical protein